MNERKKNQSDAHPTQINRVGTRSNSKMPFVFQSLSVLAGYRSFGGIVISEHCLAEQKQSELVDVLEKNRIS